MVHKKTPKVESLQNGAQTAGEVSDDSINPIVQCALHIRGIVDCPRVYFQSKLMCSSNKAAGQEPEPEYRDSFCHLNSFGWWPVMKTEQITAEIELQPFPR
jgi:hypothetical protein